MVIIKKAKVRTQTGKARNWFGTIANGAVTPISPVPCPAWVGIAQDETGFYLLHFDSENNLLTDSWHSSLGDAKEQARFEFEIADLDWEDGAGKDDIGEKNR